MTTAEVVKETDCVLLKWNTRTSRLEEGEGRERERVREGGREAGREGNSQ